MKRKDENGLSRGQAKYLYSEFCFGGTYLVKDKDNTCWIVDHGAGDLAKEDDHWIDTEGPEWQENSFQEAKYDFNIVSWDDETPLNIQNYLKSHGWLKDNGDFVD